MNAFKPQNKILEKDKYFKALSSKNVLDRKPVNSVLKKLNSNLTLTPVPPQILKQSAGQSKITEELTRLPIFVATGKRSWNGLVVAFPGSKRQLTTEIVGTPYLRRILYPILDLHHRLIVYYNEPMPCIYLLGSRFPDVILRKFKLLESLTPHIIILTSDLLTSSNQLNDNIDLDMDFPTKVNESWVQTWLCREMSKSGGLNVPVGNNDSHLGLLGKEMPTSEGTTQPERLDILGYDKLDHSLVAFEIKGPDCSRIELENLFLQGLEHQKWLEKNKMSIKYAFDGPRGRRINTRKRVRLLLGFFQEDVPKRFWELRNQALRYDKYLQIDFVQFRKPSSNNGNLILKRLCE
jgi:hypothetical protein